MGHVPPASWLRHHDRSTDAMANLDIIIPGPEMESDPEATALWEQTGSFIGTALARMERGKAFSIILGRLQHELREAYGAENARKVLQAIMDTMERVRLPRFLSKVFAARPVGGPGITP